MLPPAPLQSAHARHACCVFPCRRPPAASASSKTARKIRATRQQHQHAALSAANEQAFKIKAAVNPFPVLLRKALENDAVVDETEIIARTDRKSVV